MSFQPAIKMTNTGPKIILACNQFISTPRDIRVFFLPPTFCDLSVSYF